MKKVLIFLMSIIFLIPCVGNADVDLAQMPIEEIIALRNEINIFLWESGNWPLLLLPNHFTHIPESIQQNSGDPHIWYIRDYVGRNARSLVEDLKTYFMYGNISLRPDFVTSDGGFIDYSTREGRENASNYIIVEQSIPPGTELVFEYEKDNSGEENYLSVISRNYDTIVLYAERIIEN